MEKMTKSFFGEGIVIYGCTKADNMYYKRLYKHFSANGVKVYGLPTTPESELNFNTYPDLDAIPQMPACAFVLCEKEKTLPAVEDLQRHGIKQILFYSEKFASDEAVAFCKENGMEVRFGCPLILYAPASCYLHAAIGGYLDERKR